MLNIKSLNEEVISLLLQRGIGIEVMDTVKSLDNKRLNYLQNLELINQQIKQEAQRFHQEGIKGDNNLKDRQQDLKKELISIEDELNSILLNLPNIPSADIPKGANEKDNVEMKTWGNEFISIHPLLSHDEIGEQLDLFSSSLGVKVSKSKFLVLKGKGAALERALITFMLDTHIERGYTEVSPPLLINKESLQGTGQLPKFSDELFTCERDSLYLLPTAEVPLVNLYRDEILTSLSINVCSATPCFRREAGGYGSDTKGLIRLHQFNKVELVKLVHPSNSEEEHLKLLEDCEYILQELKLPYRVIELCIGDLGFSACKTFDIEVWIPSQSRYREISSVSNTGDFQARRSNIKYKEGNSKPIYVHTLNGSGLAVGRTMAAILENYQTNDGRIIIPEVLRKYMNMEYLG